MARESLPDRWRYPLAPFPSSQETRGLLLLSSFVICFAVCLMCFWQISMLCRAMKALPLDPALQWRLVDWLPPTFASLVFSVLPGFSIFRWHQTGEHRART